MANEPAEQISELERVKLENYALKHNSLQRQLQDNLAERAAFIKQIVDTHPALRWDDTRGFVSKDERPAAPERIKAVGNGARR